MKHLRTTWQLNKPMVIRLALLFATLDLCLLIAGCTTAWTTEASNIITLLVPAVQAVFLILQSLGAGVPSTVLTSVQAWSTEAVHDLNDVIKPLIDQYNAAEVAAQPGILAQIDAAIGVLVTNLNTILPTLHVENANQQARIVAIVTLIANELTALMNLVPAIQGKVTSHHEFKALMSALKSPEEFKKEFNAEAGAFGKEFEIS